MGRDPHVRTAGLESVSDGRLFLLMAVYAAWVIVFVYSFVAFARAPIEGAGFPDGLSRAAVYFGWQGLAGTLAIAVFGIGTGWPKGSAVRRLAALPLVPALLHLLAIAVIAILTGGV